MKQETPKILIVDGHNAIFAIAEIEQLHRKHQEAGRELLVRYLQDLHDRGEWEVVVVFDGKGPKRTKTQHRSSDLMIIYSRSGETADTVIEQLALKYASECDLCVATNDHLESLMSRHNGAKWMRISELEAIL